VLSLIRVRTDSSTCCASALAENTPAVDAPVDFNLLDAVRADTQQDAEALDPDMQKIQDLLTDYLQSLSPTTASVYVLTKISVNKDETANMVPNSMPDDGDYVWDVFYRKTASSRVWPTTGIIGTLCVAHLHHVPHLHLHLI
jgi:hypothetical protein